jgi:glutamine amidotransferase
MCRILAVRADDPVDLAPWLDAFRSACLDSREYQGHGWGVVWREANAWTRHRSVTPIWDDDFVPPPTRLAIVHARSAFRNEGITVENAMPFVGERLAFAFNGELRGVRLRVPGANGAARLHALVERFVAAGDDAAAAARRLDQVIRVRTDYVRALNVVTSGGHDLTAHCRYSEDPDYFTLHHACPDDRPSFEVVCSERIRTDEFAPTWRPMENGETLSLRGSVAC